MEEREDHFTAETKVRWPSNLSEQSPFHVFNNNNFFYARNLHLNMAGPSPSLASISAGPHGRPVRPEPLGLFRTSSSRVSSGPIRQVRWPPTRRAISRFHFCPHDPRAHAALRSMSRYVHVRARLCLHARAVWHAAEHAHDLRRSTRATPCPVRAGRGFSS